MTEGIPSTPLNLGEIYPPESLISINGQEVTLGWAMAMEEMMCQADTERRADPNARNQQFAKMLHEAGTLRSEHFHLLPPREE